MLHDGFYGCGTGAGYANRTLLNLVVDELPSGSRLLVMPVLLRPDSPEYDATWHRDTRALLARANTTLVTLDNGTNGTVRFGGLPCFRRLVENTADALHELIPNGTGPALLLALDAPFLGLAPRLSPHLIRRLVLVPRSSAKIHAPLDRERVAWETHGLLTATYQGGRIAAISAFMRRHLADCYYVPESNVVDLPDGLVQADWAPTAVDEAALPPPPAGRGGFLLAMGRPTHYKGFDDLLDALRMLRCGGHALPHTVLAAVTDGGQISDYQRAPASRISHEPLDITLITRFDPAVRGLLRHPALRAVVVPSRAEPFGRIPLEAHVAGATPVVATTAGGLAEQIIDGLTGFAATPDDPAALAAAVERALALTETEREQMRTAARTDARQRFDHAAGPYPIG